MSTMRRIFGAFRILRRRSAEVGQPGLGIWADAGERATGEVQAVVTKQAHVAEIDDREAAKEIAEGLAELRAGQPIKAAMAHSQRADRLVAQGAEAAHDIGEVVS